MLDPVTLSAAVSAANIAYNGIKKAMQASKDIEDVTGVIGKWMTAVSDVDNINKRASNPSQIDRIFNGSVEEVALESFAAKKKIAKQRQELKNFVTAHYGMTAWDEILRSEGKIRAARQKAIYAREEKMKQIREFIIITIATLVGAGCIVAMAWLIFFAPTST
tara:strand:+ start:1241 stop:1729 length:489 start_codon:yes stop_codon:yes gene_type:complete